MREQEPGVKLGGREGERDSRGREGFKRDLKIDSREEGVQREGMEEEQREKGREEGI